jgi:hypothetical protein
MKLCLARIFLKIALPTRKPIQKVNNGHDGGSGENPNYAIRPEDSGSWNF